MARATRTPLKIQAQHAMQTKMSKAAQLTKGFSLAKAVASSAAKLRMKQWMVLLALMDIVSTKVLKERPLYHKKCWTCPTLR